MDTKSPGSPFYFGKKKTSETSLSSSSTGSSKTSSSSSSQSKTSEGRFVREAQTASKALLHSGSSEQSKSHSVRTMLETTKKLYDMKVGGEKLVPDAEDFNKLLMLVIAEVADNTRSAYMRDYPRPTGAAGLLEEKTMTDKTRFPKGSIQARIVGQGIAALQRCATKYLETGGDRFLSVLDMSSKKTRRRPPGKTLLLVFKDFHLYDSVLRKTRRHLPAASLPPFNVGFNRDAEVYQCGVLKRHQRLANPPTVSKAQIQEIRQLSRELFKLAKQVGANLARCVAPMVGDEVLKKASKAQLEEALKGSNGLLTNLHQVTAYLSSADSTFRAERTLVRFLLEAVQELSRVAGNACEAHLGKAACAKSSSSGKSSSAESSPSSHSSPSPGSSWKSSPSSSAASTPRTASLSPAFLHSLGRKSPARKDPSRLPKLSPSFLSKFSTLKTPHAAAQKDTGSSSSSATSSNSRSSSVSSHFSKLSDKRDEKPEGIPLQNWHVSQVNASPAPL